jgi:hypothetical protein
MKLKGVLTVDDLIAAATKFKAQHGGDAYVRFEGWDAIEYAVGAEPREGGEAFVQKEHPDDVSAHAHVPVGVVFHIWSNYSTLRAI